MKLRVKHILVRHQYEAEDILRLLERGQAFEGLAEKFSLCPSGKSGGDLGEVRAEQLDSDFAQAAAELDLDQISKVVRTRFGYHLIKRV